MKWRSSARGPGSAAGPELSSVSEAGERVAKQVGRLRRGDERRDIGAEFTRVIGIRVIRAGRLVLAALVHRDDPAARCGELAEDRGEILLAAGVAGHEQSRTQLTRSGGGHRVERGELAA